MDGVFIITKDFHFSASHVLHGLREGHPCGRLHGHNYVVRVELSAEETNAVGFVQDYGELSPVRDFIDGELDHRHLNDVFDFQPSAENMAYHIFHRFADQFPTLRGVSVSETPKTWATYRKLG
jgi:6-pyruvoyltetrahydropterin/6-carboxytetrahydropterin synthase